MFCREEDLLSKLSGCLESIHLPHEGSELEHPLSTAHLSLEVEPNKDIAW